MTVLLAVYDDRRCIARCDATCYEATERVCRCICGGVNHGKGLTVARANVEMGAGRRAVDLAAFKAARSLRCDEVVVIDRLRVPSNRRAKVLVEHQLYMRRHQLELPFEKGADGSSV